MNDVKTVLIAIGIAIVISVVATLGLARSCSGDAPLAGKDTVRDTVQLVRVDTVFRHQPTGVYVRPELPVIAGDCDEQIGVRDSIIDALAYEKWLCENVVAEAIVDEPQLTGSIHFLMNEFLRNPGDGFQLDLRAVNTATTETVTVTEYRHTWWDRVKDWLLVALGGYVAIELGGKLISPNK